MHQTIRPKSKGEIEISPLFIRDGKNSDSESAIGERIVISTTQSIPIPSCVDLSICVFLFLARVFCNSLSKLTFSSFPFFSSSSSFFFQIFC